MAVSTAIQVRLAAGEKAVYTALQSLLKRKDASTWRREFSWEIEKFVPAAEVPETEVTDDDVPF
jgi:hypothetical protein